MVKLVEKVIKTIIDKKIDPTMHNQHQLTDNISQKLSLTGIFVKV
jgi:hypothetical protein